MLSKKINVYLFFLVLFPLESLAAANFSTDFLDLSFQVKPTGFSLDSGRDINESLAILGGVSTDSESEDDNYDLYVGPQLYGPLVQGVDLNAQLLIHYNKNSLSSNEQGVAVEGNVGVRAWIAPRLEANLVVGSNGTHSIFTFGARLYLSDRAAFSLSSKNNGIYGPQIQLGVRYNFI